MKATLAVMCAVALYFWFQKTYNLAVEREFSRLCRDATIGKKYDRLFRFDVTPVFFNLIVAGFSSDVLSVPIPLLAMQAGRS